MLNQTEQIKQTIEGLVGETVKLKANRGRNKSFYSTGRITSAHPNLFVFEAPDRTGSLRRYAFCYSDVLTHTVRLARTDTANAGQPSLL